MRTMVGGLLLPYTVALGTLDSNNLSFVASYPLGPSYDLRVADSVVFVAVAGGVAVYDVSDPSSPSLVALPIRTSGFIVEMEYDPVRRVLYLGDFFGKVGIWDVSSPASPTHLTDIDLPFPVLALFLDGANLYVGTGSGGVIIYDVSLPSAPTPVGGFTVSPYVLDIFVAGGLAYVSADSGGIYIYDVSDPSSPALVSNLREGWRALAAYRLGNYLFVGADSSGLVVVDVSDISSPTTLSVYGTGGRAGRLSVAGSLLFLANGPGGVLAFDVSDPSTPTLTFSVPSPDGSYVLGAYPGDTLLYVCHSIHGLEVYDISDPVGMHEVAYYTYDSYPKALVQSGGYLYVALYGGLSVLNVSDPTAPYEVGSVPDTILGDPRMEVDGSRLYVLLRNLPGNVLLGIYDLSSPSDPTLMDTLPLYDGPVPYFTALDDTLYVVEGSGVGIYANGSRISTIYPSDTQPCALAVSPPNLYVLTRGNLYRYDISDPTSPIPVDSTSLPSHVCRLLLYSGRLYLMGPYDLMALDTATLGVLSTAPLPIAVGLGGEMRAGAGKVYVTVQNAYESVLCAYDTTPAPLECEFLPYPLFYGRFDVGGSYAYLISDRTVRVWEVSSPSRPVFLAREEGLTLSHTGSLLLEGRLYVGDYAGFFNVFDLSTPGDPQLLNRARTPDSLEGVGEPIPCGGYACAFAPFLVVLSLGDTPSVVASLDTTVFLDSLPIRVLPRQGVYKGGYVFGIFGRYLAVYDVSSPTSPVLTDFIAESLSILNLNLKGDTLILMARDGDFNYRLLLYAVSDPSAPSPLGEVPLNVGSLRSYGRFASGDGALFTYAYDPSDYSVYLLALGYDGGLLDSVPLSPPTYPNRYPLSVRLNGDTLLVADRFSFGVWDVSDPTSLRLLGYRVSVGVGRDLLKVGDYVVASVGTVGLHVYRLTTTAVREDRPVGALTVEGRKGHVLLHLERPERVKIYDAAGRLRYGKVLGEGEHRVPLPSGVFFVKVGPKTFKVVVR